MARKRKVKVAPPVKTLLEMYESFQREFPDKYHWLEEQRRLNHLQLFGRVGEDPKITELHNRVEKEYRKSQATKYDGPPLIHIKLQYAKAVTQSRYEASLLSNIIHEADNVMDAVTGDEDDNDYESLISVGKSGIGEGIMSGLGLSKKALPELRILIVKVTNLDSLCSEPIQLGRVTVIFRDEKKSHKEKTAKREPDYKHRIGFHHVFNYRGLSIENFQNIELNIEVKLYSGETSHKACIVLSTDGCTMGEVDDMYAGEVETDISFWKEYIEGGSEQIIELTLPLLESTNETPKEKDDRASSPDEVKETTKKKKKRRLDFSLFS